MLKKVIILVIGVFLGYGLSIMGPIGTAYYKQWQDLSHNPKFKKGDCIESYGSFKSKIIDLTKNNDYIYSIDINCKNDKNCLKSIAPSRNIDEAALKIDCPIL